MYRELTNLGFIAATLPQVPNWHAAHSLIDQLQVFGNDQERRDAGITYDPMIDIAHSFKGCAGCKSCFLKKVRTFVFSSTG